MGVEWMIRACLMLGLRVAVTGALDPVTHMYPLLYLCVSRKELQEEDLVEGTLVFEHNHYSILMGRAVGPHVPGLPVFHALPLKILKEIVPATSVFMFSSTSSRVLTL